MQSPNVSREFSVSGFHSGIGNILGFQQEDYEIKWIMDNREFFSKNSETWKRHFGAEKLIYSKGMDEYVEGEYIQAYCEIPDVIVSSPSCAQLSKLGMKRKDRPSLKTMKLNDFDFIRTIKTLFILSPKFIILEYLKNLTDYFIFDNHEIIQRVTDESLKIPDNYNYEIIELNSIYFKVSQNRKRLFFFFWKKEYDFKFKVPILLDHEIKKAKEVLLDVELIDGLFNNESPNHSQKRIDRFNKLKPGESYYGGANNKRIDPEKVCPTITSSKTQHVHPWNPRVLTVREAAYIQGFPLDFQFFGSFSDNLDLIGKTISPPVAREIAKQITLSLTKGKKHGSFNNGR